MSLSSYRPAGFCPKCGYPFDGGTCPECGSATAPEKLLPVPPCSRLRLFIRVGSTFLFCAIVIAALVWLHRTAYWVRLVPSGTLIELASRDVLKSGPYGGYWYVDEEVVAAAKLPSLAVRELTRRYRVAKLSRTELGRILAESVEVGSNLGLPAWPDEEDLEWTHLTVLLKDPAKTFASVFGCELRHGNWRVWVDDKLIACPEASATRTDGLPWLVLEVHFDLPALPLGTHTIRVHGHLELVPLPGAGTDLGHEWEIDVSQTIHVR